MENEDVNLGCTFTGSPDPNTNIAWFKLVPNGQGSFAKSGKYKNEITLRHFF